MQIFCAFLYIIQINKSTTQIINKVGISYFTYKPTNDSIVFFLFCFLTSSTCIKYLHWCFFFHWNIMLRKKAFVDNEILSCQTNILDKYITYMIPWHRLCVNDWDNAWPVTIIQGRGVSFLGGWGSFCTRHAVDHGLSKHCQTFKCTLVRRTGNIKL